MLLHRLLPAPQLRRQALQRRLSAAWAPLVEQPAFLNEYLRNVTYDVTVNPHSSRTDRDFGCRIGDLHDMIMIC